MMNLQDVTQAYNFSGKTIVVTGGTGILCSKMAQALVGCGANVAILARNMEKAQAMWSPTPSFDTSGQDAGRVFLVEGDVLERDTLLKAVERVLAEFGQIDGLINGAGGNQAEATTTPDKRRPFFDLPEEALRYVFDLNLLGTIMPSQIFGQTMANQHEGVILNVSSMASTLPMTRVLGYSAAKAGVNNFTYWLAVHMAQEYSPHIRVNAIAPGFFLTEQNRYLLTDPETGDLTDRGQIIIDQTPMSRFGDPEDLLGATLWLLSPASKFVTGIVVAVDGGFSAFSGV